MQIETSEILVIMNKKPITPNILVIVTGGLITQTFSEDLGYVSNSNPREIIDSLSNEIDTSQIEIIEFSTVDSSSFDLDYMHSLAKLVQRKINNDNIDGIAIISGSDTMEILGEYYSY